MCLALSIEPMINNEYKLNVTKYITLKRQEKTLST